MATVDIEPASLAVTPGESHVLTLTITNDGDDVEAFHVAAVDDAVAYVTIAPDTLLVRAGETASATATLTLENTGRWPVGDIIVRFHVVPAGRPDDFLVVEAIAAIQSFSDVAAVLSPDALEAFRSSTAEVTITNAGNAYTYAEVSLSAGELALSINQSHVALPADSAETVGLRVGARSLLWRGAPEQHPFVVTVSPEGAETISLDGTFTQKPLLPRWSRTAAIAVGAVVAVALLVWGVAALPRGPGGSGGATADTSSTETATPTPTPLAPVVSIAADAPDLEEKKGGDAISITLEPELTGAPADSLLAVAIDWPDELVFTDSDCTHWVEAETTRVLKGDPLPGDECVVSASGTSKTATLSFATPPAGLKAKEVTATATRLLTSAGSGVDDLETAPESEFGADTVGINIEPYPFWMEVEDLGPNEDRDDVVVTIHRGVDGGGDASVTFDVGLPDFVSGIQESHDKCGLRVDTTCFATVQSGATSETIPMRLNVAPSGGIGMVEVKGTFLNGVAEGADQQVRGARGLLVSDHLFDVVMAMGRTDTGPDGVETATAFIQVKGTELPQGVDAFDGGSWQKTLQLGWPEGLTLIGEPDECTLSPDRRCALPWLEISEDAEITLQFAVEDGFDGGSITANGADLRYDPTTDDEESDGRPQQPEDWSRFAHWIGSASCTLDQQCE